MSFTTKLKALFRVEPEKSFVKAGFLDENEELTVEGRQALTYIIWEANKVTLKELADKVIAADKESN